MNEYLAESIKLYEQEQGNFHALFAWHLHHGIVVCSDWGFGMACYTHHDDPDQPVEIEKSDTLFVTMCCGSMWKCLSAFQNDFKFISFKREFKNSPMIRVYPMDRFIKSLNTKE